LDSVQDPHNLGAILRTAEATAVDAIIVPLRNTAPFSETVEKASTGALNRLKICRVDNLAKTLDALKKENFWIVGTSLEAEKDFTELDYRMPVVIVLGNEGKGIRPSVLSRCDFLVKIPMFGKVQSLNVSVSAGVLLYEVIKQRKKKNE
jgi:23S rRNA (guanosine2251-2'-O)-methyltransferase